MSAPQRPDLVRFEERLEDATAIAGRLAHAFDNVLTGIVGFAELTLGLTSTDSAPHQYVSEVLRAAQLGVQFTQQLHALSRCSSAGNGPTALGLVVADEEMRLLQTVKPVVRVQFALPAELPAVALDADALRQLLGNLLDNAVESLLSEGAVTTTARQTEITSGADWFANPAPGAYVEIAVADTGSGLSAEARQRLFVEPFFTTKPRHRGLGLPVVCRIVSTHQGGFRLEPGAKGGTVARVLLPAASGQSSMR